MEGTYTILWFNIFMLVFLHYSAGTLLIDSIYMDEDASFVNYLTGTKTLKSCRLKFQSTEIDLDLDKPSNYTGSDELVSRISSLGRGLCGFKFTNARLDVNGLSWTLTATDYEGSLYTDSFVTLIATKLNESLLHTKAEVSLGTSMGILCGNKFNNDFCHLFNPAGEFIRDVRNSACDYIISPVTVDDIGVWRCYTGNSKTMESVDYTIELVQNTGKAVETWVNETEEYVNIGCRLGNCVSCRVNLCKMIAPNQLVFNLRPHMATNRYLALGTDLDKSTCSMQIKKPLKEFEKGTWQCELGTINVTGGLINVDKEENTDYPKYIELKPHVDKPFTIFCKVPYSTDYCYIQSPNGTKYFSSKASETRLGRCSITIPAASFADDGAWMCAFARKTGKPDDIITVEVKVAPTLSSSNIVNVELGKPAQLICHSSGLPLKYCRFVSSQGIGYHLRNHEASDTVSYYGRGLEYGECGITLPDVQREDLGIWTCQAEIFGSPKPGELSRDIFVVT